ncbi:uncharacterized protein LOC131928117 [Physella acuta]|uniref:uncharacterized protein LOC131928117 n=1 Tax=Physella acuta TaxID=109671 RepID=UPI0027DD1711|nr:uncharacterized protein LOC131928117 [Physella acuta]
MQVSTSKTVTSASLPKKNGARPTSPVMISRSSQTEFTSGVSESSLKDKPHPLYDASKAGVNADGTHRGMIGDQDSDSGYSSPLHQSNYVNLGIQVHPENLLTTGAPPEESGPSKHSGKRSDPQQRENQVKKSGTDSGSKERSGKLKFKSGEKIRVEISGSESRKKKSLRDGVRSPRLLGANTKLLSRSSSSVSSSGTRQDDDDEKIDLHSWTDFPPMLSRGPSTSSSSGFKSTPPLNLDERVPLTIERSAHEPPWSIKFSMEETRSGRSRSSSGEKEQNLLSASSSDQQGTSEQSAAWGNIGRNFRPGLDQELSVLMSGSDAMPVFSPTAKASSASPNVNYNSSVVSKTGHGVNKAGKLDRKKGSGGQQSVDIPGIGLREQTVLAVSTKSSTSSMSSSVVSSVTTSVTMTTNSATPTLTSSHAKAGRSSFKGRDPAAGNKTKGKETSSHELNRCGGTDSGSAQFTSDPAGKYSTGGLVCCSHMVASANTGAKFTVAPTVPTHLTVNLNMPPPPPSSILHGPSLQSYANITQGAALKGVPPPGVFPPGVNFLAQRGMTPAQTYNTPPFTTPPYAMLPNPPYPYFTGAITSQPPPVSYGVVSQFPVDQVPHPCFQSKNSTSINYSMAAKKPPSSYIPSRQPVPTGASINRQSDNHVTKPAVQKNKDQPDETQGNPEDVDPEKKKKTRRRRRRNRSKKGDDEGEAGGGPSSEQSALNSSVSETTLHFEDVDEFPDLLPASTRAFGEDGVVGGERSTLSGTSVTYSDIIKSTFSKAGSQSRTQSLTGSCVSGDEDDASCHTGTTNESKKARKRRKRREQANKAAEAELAEISLEQQWLKEVGLKKSANHTLSGKPIPGVITNTAVVSEAKKQGKGAGGKKSQQPMALDIAAMIDAIQKKPATTATGSLTNKHVTPSGNINKGGKKERTGSVGLPGNILDSSAPVQKRGKERENGKAKKPSPLKKVILKEREQKKRLRLLDEDPDSATGLDSVGGVPGVGIVGGESELSQDALSSKSEGTDGGDGSGAAELSADLSPISQTSPISMSPASPGNSGVNSPITGSIGRDPVVMKIHSRRFREYCTQILDKDIDQCCTSLLQDLVKFQDRMYHKDPVKAKTKRRVVLGLREVTKHLKLKKIKCVVISPNLEKIQSKGGLDEALNNILNMCQDQSVPFVFALGRRALGRACAKLVPVSVVGIFNYEGCEPKYNSLISLTAAAREAYNEMVLAVEKEVAEYPSIASQTSSIGGIPGLYAAHMGHSRTPSGCSAISFTSSILSEPISENFPHAEPEVDSKGYEIVRDAAGNVVHPSGGTTKPGQDFDDGNEADTEDFGENRRKKKGNRNTNSVRFGDMVGARVTVPVDKDGGQSSRGGGGGQESADDGVGKLSRNVSESTLINEDSLIRKGDLISGQCNIQEDFEDQEDSDGADNSGEVRVRRVAEPDQGASKWAMAHIDSIHSNSYNLGNEILSQHSLTHDPRVRGQMSQLSPSSLSAVCGSELRQKGSRGHGVDEEDDDDDDAVDEYNDDEQQEEEEGEEVDEEEEKAKSHHRIIDKERIKNWLESQSNITTED